MVNSEQALEKFRFTHTWVLAQKNRSSIIKGHSHINNSHISTGRPEEIMSHVCVCPSRGSRSQWTSEIGPFNWRGPDVTVFALKYNRLLLLLLLGERIEKRKKGLGLEARVSFVSEVQWRGRTPTLIGFSRQVIFEFYKFQGAIVSNKTSFDFYVVDDTKMWSKEPTVCVKFFPPFEHRIQLCGSKETS